MEVDTAIQLAYDKVCESKASEGFLKGQNDCFALVAWYHYFLFEDTTILDLTKVPYDSELQLQKNLQKAGYQDIPALFLGLGYTPTRDTQKGDVASGFLPFTRNKTLMISLGNNTWLTSSFPKKHDRLRVMSHHLPMIGRPPYV